MPSYRACLKAHYFGFCTCQTPLISAVHRLSVCFALLFYEISLEENMQIAKNQNDRFNENVNAEVMWCLTAYAAMMIISTTRRCTYGRKPAIFCWSPTICWLIEGSITTITTCLFQKDEVYWTRSCFELNFIMSQIHKRLATQRQWSWRSAVIVFVPRPLKMPRRGHISSVWREVQMEDFPFMNPATHCSKEADLETI